MLQLLKPAYSRAGEPRLLRLRAATVEAVGLWPVLHNNEKLLRTATREKPPLAATRESPQSAMKTQGNPKKLPCYP